MLEQINDRLKERQIKPIQERQAYAILLPLIEEAGQLFVLYQVRSQLVPQPSEVAFPGGRIEPGETPEQAAVRETCEELNLHPDQIRIMGELDYLVQGSRTVYGFVGLLTIDDWRQLRPNAEVERLFALPLSHLRAEPPTYYQLSYQLMPNQAFPFDNIPKGKGYPFSNPQRPIPFYEQSDPMIWGMTALFTHHFTQLLNTDD